MRKIIIQEMISVDGFFAGPNGELDWHHIDEEFNKYARETLDNAGLLMFGRVTYDLMASYWPTDMGTQDDAVIAQSMNSLPKVVFSKEVKNLTWNNTTLLRDINKADVLAMKEAAGKDIVIYGSGTIVTALTELQLIDEYRLIVNPVILGKGKTLFAGMQDRQNLLLVHTQAFTSGNVLLTYKPS